MDVGANEQDIPIRPESSTAILSRHAEERAALNKRMERIKSSIPRKDRSGRARHAEQAAEEEKALLDRQARECAESNITEEMIASISNLVIGTDSSTVAKNETAAPKNESKAARRRRKKAEEEAASKKRIEEEKAAMGPSAKFVESQAIDAQLKPQQLRIHPVPADGHCLYSAVAHQMELNNIDSSVAPTVQDLRNATANHLMNHKDSFMPFIETVDSDDTLFRAYCDQLRNEAVWGGQVELRALSEILGVNIEVYAANMPVVKMGDNTATQTTFRVSFHREYFGLGEHYNSIISKSP